MINIIQFFNKVPPVSTCKQVGIFTVNIVRIAWY